MTSQKFDYLLQQFLRGKSTRKQEKELLNIVLKDMNSLLKIFKKTEFDKYLNIK